MGQDFCNSFNTARDTYNESVAVDAITAFVEST